MLLLTGATGLVGSALLRACSPTASRCAAWCATARLGAQRVRVQIALGDLADPRRFATPCGACTRWCTSRPRSATSRAPRSRSSTGSPPGGWCEAAERQGVERFVFFSALGASTHHRARLLRAKALAEQAVREAGMRSAVIAPSIVYAPGDRWLTLLERMALLPAVPVSGRGRARLPADLGRGRGGLRDRGTARARRHRRAGGAGRRPRAPRAGGPGDAHPRRDGPHASALPEPPTRALVHVPTPIVSRALRGCERLGGQSAFATWDEAELMEVPMISPRGAAAREALGVEPARMAAVLAGGPIVRRYEPAHKAANRSSIKPRKRVP